MRWARPTWRTFRCLTGSGAAEARLYYGVNFPKLCLPRSRCARQQPELHGMVGVRGVAVWLHSLPLGSPVRSEYGFGGFLGSLRSIHWSLLMPNVKGS